MTASRMPEVMSLVRLLKHLSPVWRHVLLVEPCSPGQVAVVSVYQPTPVHGIASSSFVERLVHFERASSPVRAARNPPSARDPGATGSIPSRRTSRDGNISRPGDRRMTSA
jgi:hypothetical protein